ncbi:excalibur calcium-binding domain-containing protein [Sphingomonas panacis]|uniref:excalibur calcium-binding domain-containing protein n=1 Tax=Sphingomonas panacis TaxID=1560345 RepID=UPI0009F4A4D5|nr:excalibur calcium-binding domain-containing protein [Sphingomonas panacis]
MRRRSSFDQTSSKRQRRFYPRQTRSKPVPVEARLLGAAAALGAVVGLGSIAASGGGPQRIASAAHSLAVTAGVSRARAPQSGDYWSGCDAARAAGTAPIYRGEPGYRTEMDGDDDGIACEPYRGN